MLALPKIDDLQTIDARILFNGSSEVLIQHRDAVYRLRITKAGKLILTK